MRVYLLNLTGRSPLTRAFDRVMDCADVASCAIEPESNRIRFLASAKVGDKLVESIYLDGGLAWCSRHTFLPAQEGGVVTVLADERDQRSR